MKKLIVLISVVFAFTLHTNAQIIEKNNVFENETEDTKSKFIEDIKFSTKNIVIEPNKFKVVELFNIPFSFMLDETGKSKLPFQMVKPKKDLETQINYLTGEQTKITHHAWVAKYLFNADHDIVDEYNPKGLTAEKKRKKKGKLYVEYGDFHIEIPDERLIINNVLYLFFKETNPYTNEPFIIVTAVDKDFYLSTIGEGAPVYFVNNNQYYILVEEELEVEQRDRLTFVNPNEQDYDREVIEITPVTLSEEELLKNAPKGVKMEVNNNQQKKNPRFHRVRKGDSFGKIAKAYGISVSQLQKLNPEIKDANKIYVGNLIRIY